MGFWRKFAKIASIAAPIAAAPFTGGLSLAALGAGAGVAGSKLRGESWKKSLLMGGLGAIPGVGKLGRLAGPSAGIGSKIAGGVRTGMGIAKGAGDISKVINENDQPWQIPSYAQQPMQQNQMLRQRMPIQSWQNQSRAF